MDAKSSSGKDEVSGTGRLYPYLKSALFMDFNRHLKALPCQFPFDKTSLIFSRQSSSDGQLKSAELQVLNVKTNSQTQIDSPLMSMGIIRPSHTY